MTLSREKPAPFKGRNDPISSPFHDLLLPLKKQMEEDQKSRDVADPYEEKSHKDGQQDLLQQTLDWLYSTFPDCFSRTHPKPLKRRIEKDIYPYLTDELSISRIAIRRAIAFYTRWFKYRQALAHASHRYDLTGNPVEEILSEHKERAHVQLQEQQKYRREHQKKSGKGKNFPFSRHKKLSPHPHKA